MDRGEQYVTDILEDATGKEPWFDFINAASRIIFPSHKCELVLTHNLHKNLYITVQEAIERGEHGYRPDDWVSMEQRMKAARTNECWTLQWYPDTPVGFCLKSAADLNALLRAASER